MRLTSRQRQSHVRRHFERQDLRESVELARWACRAAP